MRSSDLSRAVRLTLEPRKAAKTSVASVRESFLANVIVALTHAGTYRCCLGSALVEGVDVDQALPPWNATWRLTVSAMIALRSGRRFGSEEEVKHAELAQG